ncbi:hypothetical protein ABFP60_01910 [Clostridioides difficile]
MIIKCPQCNKLIFKAKLNGYLRYEIKCPRCKCQIVAVERSSEYNVRSKKRKIGGRL